MERTRNWMLRNARPLDWARWHFHFESGSAANVLDALSAYQNADGGFGNGLEADCWNPASSPIQTWCALTVLREIGFPAEAKSMLRGIRRYLMSGDAFDGHYWQSEIASNNAHPHAPWWHVGEDGPAKGYNPTASLAGALLRFGDGEAKALGERLAEEAIAWLMSQMQMEQHTLACFMELQEDLAATGDRRAEDIAPRIIALADGCVCREAEKWFTSYCCKPSNLLRSRESILYPRLKELAAQECGMLAAICDEQGVWPVTWDWHAYPDAWPVAKTWWQGDIAVKNTLFLKRFAKGCLQS